MRESILRLDESGQGWVETVVMLPVLVFLLLGLFYMKGLVNSRMRAIEAARYLAWETVWHVRENQENRAVRSIDDLKKELEALGLGRGLIEVTLDDGLSVGQYRRSFDGGVEEAGVGFFAPDAVLPNLFGATSEELQDEQSSILEQLQGEDEGQMVPDEIKGALDGGLNFGGQLLSSTHDLFAFQTLWADEARAAVRTAVVRYEFRTNSPVFEGIAPVRIVERASLLSHPYNIRRSDDAAELAALIGAPSFGCAQAVAAVAQGGNKELLGHIFDLFLYPSGEVPADVLFFDGAEGVGADLSRLGQGVASGGAEAGKCVLSTLGDLLSLLDVIGIRLGYKLPDGTLKEFPELATQGTSSGANGFGSSPGPADPPGGGP